MAASFLHYSATSSTSYFSKSKTQFSAHSSKPMKISMSKNNQTFRANVRSKVDECIKKTLSGEESADSIINAIDRLALEVPRSLAPALCIAACEAFGGQQEQGVQTASALHLMHVATNSPEPEHELVRAEMIKYGYQILDSVDKASNKNPVTSEIQNAMGMEEGEGFDENKGVVMSSCGAACGVILGGGSEEEREKLRRYGLYVGTIYHIMVKDELRSDKSMLKFAEKLRFLAVKELEGMKEKNIDTLRSIMEELVAFLKVQKYPFPRQGLVSKNPSLMPIGPNQLGLMSAFR